MQAAQPCSAPIGVIASPNVSARATLGTLRRVMKKASEYREHAAECRALARTMQSDEDRDQLLDMAATWDRLAAGRADWVRRHPEFAIGEEHREDANRRIIAGAG